jgi:uncharacterized membrane protein
MFALLSGVIALMSLRGLAAPLDLVMPNMAHFLQDAPMALWGHVLGAPLVLALAPVQLSRSLRARWPLAHRISGRLYALGVLIAGLSALALVPTSIASPFARAGFTALALCWIAFTARGIWLARAGDYTAHRAWMLRSLALTFAAVTLRVIMVPLMASGWSVAQTYDVTAWGSWVPSLILVELYLRRRPPALLA